MVRTSRSVVYGVASCILLAIACGDDDPDNLTQDPGGPSPGDPPGRTNDGEAPSRDGGAEGDAKDGGGFTYVPKPDGCIDDVGAGNHTYTCEGLTVDATIPVLSAKCPAAGCGLILELHGDTGTGPLIDAHLDLRARGPERGFIVLAPTGPAIGNIGGTNYPGSTWGTGADAKLISIVNHFVSTFKVDPKRIHVTGFSRGGYTSWRFVCDPSNPFASVAIGGAGFDAKQLTSNAREPTCFEDLRTPVRKIDLLLLMGRTDARYANIVGVRDLALSYYGLGPATVQTLPGDASFDHRRATVASGPTIEWFDHAYEGDASVKGHCIPGSKVPLNAPAYSVACKAPTAFDWGAEALSFFEAHRLP